MKLIAGLGNKGQKFEKTRHNIGFMVLDSLIEDRPCQWNNKSNLESQQSKTTLASKEVILAKPQTMMNSSGRALRKIKEYYDIDIEDIWLVHDDKDLVLGSLRISRNSGSAGHKGVESVINHLGTKEFFRFRVGVMTKLEKRAPRTKKEVSDFLLSGFYKEEKDTLKTMIEQTGEALKYALKKDIQKAKNKYH